MISQERITELQHTFSAASDRMREMALKLNPDQAAEAEAIIDGAAKSNGDARKMTHAMTRCVVEFGMGGYGSRRATALSLGAGLMDAFSKWVEEVAEDDEEDDSDVLKQMEQLAKEVLAAVRS